MDDSDLTEAVLSARAARLGRVLNPAELEELVESVAAGEATYAALRARPIGLLSGRTDSALGDAWLRPATKRISRDDRQGGGDR